MSIDLEKSIDEDARAMERIASSFEVIADTLVAWYKLEVQRFETDHPPKHEPRDLDLTHLPDTTDRIKADQGATKETTEEWLALQEEIGPREKEFIEQSSKAPESVRESRFDKKASRARTVKGKS